MGKYKASLYNLFFNVCNVSLTVIQGVLLIPVYLHFLSSSLYGSWLATGNVLAMLSVLEGGFSNVVTQKMSSSITNNDKEEFLKLAGSNILSAIFISLLLFLICFITSFFVVELVCREDAYQHEIWKAFIVASFAASVSIFTSLIGAFPQVWQDTRYVGQINTISVLLNIIIVVCALFAGYGVVSLALGLLIKSFFSLCFQSLWIYKKWNSKIGEKPIYSVRFTCYLIKDCTFPFLSKLSTVLIGQSQNFLIAVFISPVATTIYDITGKICICLSNLINIVYGSFFALLSLTFSSKDSIKIKSVITNVNFVISFLSIIILVFSICFTENIIDIWLGKEYYGGTLLLILISFSIVINNLNGYFNSLLYTCGLINKAAILDFLKLIFYILLLLATGSFFKIYALPISLLMSSIVFSLIYLFVICKNLNLSYGNFKIILYDLIFALVFVLFFGLFKIQLYTYLQIFIAISITFSVFFFISFLIKRQQFIAIYQFIKRK